MKKVFAVFACLVMFGAIVIAQNNADYKKKEFFAGYSLVGLDTGGSDRQGLRYGFEASGVYNFHRYFGIKGDFSAAFDTQHAAFIAPPSNTVTFDSHQRLLNFLGGVQIKDNSNKGWFKPFAHAMIGIGQTKARNDNFQCTGSCTGFLPSSVSKTGLAGAFGGGLDIRVNDRVQLRLIQMDYNPVKGLFETQHNVRLSAGIVF